MIFWIAVSLVSVAFVYWLYRVLPRYERNREYVLDRKAGKYKYKKVRGGKRRWVFYFEEWWTGVLGVLGILALWAGSVLLIVPLIFSGFMNLAIKDFTLTEEKSTDLIALETRSSINGEFVGSIFLSAGYVSENSTFNFLYSTDDGGVKVGQVFAHDATVYEDEQDDPHYVKFTWKKWDYFWAPFSVNQAHTYAFHVPEGSVVSNYEVTP